MRGIFGLGFIAVGLYCIFCPRHVVEEVLPRYRWTIRWRELDELLLQLLGAGLATAGGAMLMVRTPQVKAAVWLLVVGVVLGLGARFIVAAWVRWSQWVIENPRWLMRYARGLGGVSILLGLALLLTELGLPIIR